MAKKFLKTIILSLTLCLISSSFNIAYALPTKLINVPYINQNDIVYGCEAVSSTMVLQYYGYKISEKDFTDKYLIKKDFYIDVDGKVYGPDPNSAYPGNPYIASGDNCGYGSYASSTANSIDKVLYPARHQTKVIIGMELSDIVANYIDRDIPVLIWATMDMREPKQGDSWIIDYVDENSQYEIGDEFVWIAGEHCLVLGGDDDDNYYFNDPYKNHGVIAYNKDLVNQRFNDLGKQAVVVLKI